MLRDVADGLMGNDAHGFVACAAEGVQVAVDVREQGAGNVQPDGLAGLQHDAGVAVSMRNLDISPGTMGSAVSPLR